MIKRINLIGILTIVSTGTLVTFLNRNFRLDDALIYYRYIRNYLDGNGLVYNIGERFNALTSPLYTYLSLVLSSITREIETTQTVLNGSLLILSALLLFVIFLKQDKNNEVFMLKI